MKNYEQEFLEIIKKDDWLINLLKTVKELNLPDWFVVGGTVRNRIWDYLHGYKQNNELRDVDVIYFVDSNINPEEDKKIEAKLKEKIPHLKWDIFNQARRHLNHNQRKVNSSGEALFDYSETANCVGIRINEDNSFFVYAPYGLKDLINLIIRPVPKPYKNLKLFNQRVKEKGWFEKWPKLKIIQDEK